MDDAEFKAWHRLAHTPGLSRTAARALLRAAGSAQEAAQLDAGQVGTLAGARAAQAWEAAAGPAAQARLLAAQRWREAPGRHVRVLGAEGYPGWLLNAPDPPLLLYVLGDATLLGPGIADNRCLAVVGSRQPTPAGRAHARAFAQAFAQAGVTVVSGLAVGVDASAHEGALEGGGPTLAVIGTGPDLVYPSRHRELAARIAAQGAIVSEYPPGTPSRAEHFPQRNRIIAGLARGTLVVEAALQSGSLITARLAAEAGREVFALPGSIDSAQSRGCHALIRQGALLVETASEVLAELGWAPWPPETAPAQAGAPARWGLPAAAAGAGIVLEALGFEPTDLDTLARRTGLPGAELAARLLELELEGRVSRMPGGLFQRCGRA
jgi:DNA processing protein